MREGDHPARVVDQVFVAATPTVTFEGAVAVTVNDPEPVLVQLPATAPLTVHTWPTTLAQAAVGAAVGEGIGVGVTVDVALGVAVAVKRLKRGGGRAHLHDASHAAALHELAAAPAIHRWLPAVWGAAWHGGGAR